MDRLAAQSDQQKIWPGAVAVSGGGDSLALMHLLAAWARKTRRVRPVVLSVDHALRKSSAREARQVAAWARKAGLKAEVLTVKGPVPKSDIEARAREARFSLMGAWMAKHKIATLYVGHTEDDQAETFLLRLARGSGLDGLSAMRMLTPFPLRGLEDRLVARPLLGLGRQALRDYLETRGQDWLEDPMNSEARFARSRIREAAGLLAEAGLSTARIADAAAHLARAREALEQVTDAVLARACKPADGGLLLDPLALAAAPREIGLRAMATLLMGVGGQAYRPRFEALERLFDKVAGGRLGHGATLHGCRLGPAPRRFQAFGPQTLVLARESSRKTR